MKKRIVCVILAALMLQGCGANKDNEETLVWESIDETAGDELGENASAGSENGGTGSKESGSAGAEDSSEAADKEQGEKTGDDLTFEDLANYTYEFSSGAGGWSDEFEIEKDGYFHGNYHDSDMGDTGEGYEDGTMYIAHYSGHLGNLEKVDDLTYTMTILDMKTDEKQAGEYIEDGVRYVIAGPYALSACDSLTIYLPGTKTSKLSDAEMSWIEPVYGSSIIENDAFTGIVLVNNPNQYGIGGFERMPVSKRAKMDYDTYKESFDYYAERLTEATTTADMVQITGKQAEVADELLNELWLMVKYNTPSGQYKPLLEDQRQWLKDRDAHLKDISSQDLGTMGAVDYNDYLATETMNRCEKLLSYLVAS